MDMPVKRLGAASLLAFVSACVGTMDSLHFVKGETPQGQTCEVTVTEAGTGRPMERERVQGNFSVRYMASGPFPPKVDVSAYCNGVKVKEVKAVGARSANEIDLGKLAP
jgi:hypothetical protein